MARRLPFILLSLIAVVIAVATVVEHHHGSHVAYDWVYGAVWFKLLWGAVTASAIVLLFRKKLWRQWRVLWLHMAFVVILMGALVTSLTSRRGVISLREGETAMHYMVPDGNSANVMLLKPMPFYLSLDSFRVLYDEDGVTPANYVSYVQIWDQREREAVAISMNNIGRTHGYRIFQTSYDEDLHGTLLTVSYDPWGTGITYAGYLLLAIGMVCMSRTRRTAQDVTKRPARKYQWGLWVLAVLLSSYMVVSIAFRPLVPVLRSPMLIIHVGTIMISYVLLIVSILKRSLLKVAVFFLMAGIFLGAMWANISWGSYWSWDPKEAWALVTLIVYSIPLHQESLPWFRSDKHYRLYCLLCLLCLLMTYFGVNYLLGGMHSYA